MPAGRAGEREGAGGAWRRRGARRRGASPLPPRARTLDKVFVLDDGRFPAQRKHARLDAHGLEHGAVEVLGGARELVKVDLGHLHRHLARVDLQDAHARLFVGQRQLDLAVQAAGAHERGVQRVRPVGGGDDAHLVVGGKAVELVEQFEHRALHLAAALAVAAAALGADGVDFVDEDDGAAAPLALFAREVKGVAHHLRAVADKHLHQRRAGQLQEHGVGGLGARAREQRLAGARRWRRRRERGGGGAR